ncbi:hypothetical protein MUS1_12625 [Marinomonas ushuaiensis DSM 15871]|uniref:Uncharacterized protein n=1 Tax=Marinomonas ushuaiensis DSM 15871 TaxID=1122207 RepID=X7E4L9_9GAMM|nr:hypothetical protein [Marinomonas ushuaiensis]ETX10815.1 hypothetical protein MUS1_12625 [Marinomonas ushuaiensis DSM 15871]
MEIPPHSDSQPHLGSQPESNSKDELSAFDDVVTSHKHWLKSVLGLGALEAKMWVTSSAQLLALMCGVIFLLLTTWLLVIALVSVLAWSYGFSLLGILFSATLITFLSALIMLYFVKNTLKRMDFTRTLDAIISAEEE